MELIIIIIMIAVIGLAIMERDLEKIQRIIKRNSIQQSLKRLINKYNRSTFGIYSNKEARFNQLKAKLIRIVIRT